jgi:DNA-binding FrmR family transcriptional regulator
MLIIGGYGTAVGVRAMRDEKRDFVDVITGDVTAVKKAAGTAKDKIVGHKESDVSQENSVGADANESAPE